MLLKARLIDGPQPLNRQVEDEIRQVLYTGPPPEEVRGEIAYFRGRMETERAGEGPDRINPKLGYGGLTDIEFIVQYLQWLHGVQTHEVRKTDTLEVLQALRAVGALPEKEALSLRESHRFLTSLNHGLQLMLDRREEPRTYTRREVDRLERLNLMGLGQAPIPSWELWKHYRRVTRNIRFIFNAFFSDNHKKGRSDQAGKL
jgi:glutamate-ammonia-ligase adenylyltransferase